MPRRPARPRARPKKVVQMLDAMRMEANVTEDGRLLLDGTRIIMQILVDEFDEKLTKETKDEIQKWYDRCYNIGAGCNPGGLC